MPAHIYKGYRALGAAGDSSRVGYRSGRYNQFRGPAAIFEASAASGNAPLDIDFDASASAVRYPGATIVSYAWDFGDSTTATGVTPATKTFAEPGTYVVKLTVTDSRGFSSTTEQTIVAANTAPTCSTIADQTPAGSETTTGAIAFTIGDATTDPADLDVTATSSDQAIVPDGSITLGGSGANRTITVDAIDVGTVTITVVVSDGDLSVTKTFDVTFS